MTPEVTPETTPEVTPEATPETTPEATPEASQEANDDAEQDSAAEESKDLSAWANHIDYGKYFKHAAKDIRKGFAKVDKTYAYAKVKTSLNVREGTSKDSRIIGKLSAKALCYVIADGDKDWVYIESGDVRGFVKASYLQQGKKALKYVTKTGEDKMETAEQVVKPEDNKAFTYVTRSPPAGQWPRSHRGSEPSAHRAAPGNPRGAPAYNRDSSCCFSFGAYFFKVFGPIVPRLPVRRNEQKKGPPKGKALAVKPHRHPCGMPPPLVGAALAKR